MREKTLNTGSLLDCSGGRDRECSESDGVKEGKSVRDAERMKRKKQMCSIVLTERLQLPLSLTHWFNFCTVLFDAHSLSFATLLFSLTVQTVFTQFLHLGCTSRSQVTRNPAHEPADSLSPSFSFAQGAFLGPTLFLRKLFPLLLIHRKGGPSFDGTIISLSLFSIQLHE